MADPLERNYSTALSEIVSSQGRAGSTFINDLIKSAGINLAQTEQYGSNGAGYSGGSGFERSRFNAEQILSQEQQASNLAAVEGTKLTGTNVRNPATGNIAFTNQITKNGGVLASETTDYGKEDLFATLLKGGVTTFLGAAFGGAAGFGPLASAAGKASTLGTFGNIGSKVVGGAIQGGVNTAISGGDVGKGVIKGAVGAGVSSAFAPVFGTSTIGRAVGGAVTGSTTAALTGGDPFSAGVLGAIGGANVGKSLGLEGQTSSFVNQLANLTAQVQLQQRKQKGG